MFRLGGLLALLAGVGQAAGSTITVRSDGTWRTKWPEPSAGWNTDLDYDDSDAAGWQNAFKSPAGAFIWHSSNLSKKSPGQAWFRHKFTLDFSLQSATGHFVFDDDGQAYINGERVVNDHSGSASTFDLSLPPSLFVVGENLAAVHGRDRMGPYNNIAVVLTLTPIPEPSTLVLLGMGGVGLMGYAWRRRKRM